MTATISQLDLPHSQALFELLARDPVENLYLLGLIEDFGLTPRNTPSGYGFYGRFEGTTLTAAMFVGGSGSLIVPSSSAPEHINDIAQALKPRLRLRSALGENQCVHALVRTLRTDAPRLSRTQKLWFVSADDLGPFTNPTLRLATPDDLPQLLPLAEGYVRECLLREPLQEDATAFTMRVAARVRLQRTYVLPIDKKLVFKVDIGSRSRFGAELEGIYTQPSERRKQHAILSIGQISRHLLSSLPRLTVRIDEENSAFTHIVRRVGYSASKLQRVVLFD